MKAATLCLALATLATGAGATPDMLPTKFVAREKVVGKDGTARWIPVGEIVRAPDGTVKATGLAAPALDAQTDKLVADWKAYKQPTSVTLTEHVASGTGMHPVYNPHTFTFTPKDKLFKAAMIREFLQKHGYVAYLGMITIDFVEFDSTPEGPPGAHDRGSTRSNFRKGETIEYHGGQHTFYVGRSIRPQRGPGPGRVSPTDKTMALALGNDEGLLEIARFNLFEDGRITVDPIYARDSFQQAFPPMPSEDRRVRTYVNGSWHEHLVPKTSPRLLEAYILERLEHVRAYDVTPPIDPATVR